MQVFVMLADGFEEIEALTVVDVLRRAQIVTRTVSVSEKKEVHGAHDIPVIADQLFSETNFTDGSMIVLPGGMPGTKNLGAHPKLAEVIREYHNLDHWLAAICAAPSVLGGLGVLKGKSATCFPGFEATLQGATFVQDRVVVDGKVITSRGAGTAMQFSLTLVELLKGKEIADQLKDSMLVQ